VRASFAGDRKLFPEHVIPACEKIELQTEKFNKLHINFLFCYGARQEIVHSMRQIAQKVKSGEISESDINENMLQSHFWTSDFPEPNVIVRTGGRSRLSNFLLFQAAYSELCFLDCLWPDLDQNKLEEVYSRYSEIQRNLGV